MMRFWSYAQNQKTTNGFVAILEYQQKHTDIFFLAIFFYLNIHLL